MKNEKREPLPYTLASGGQIVSNGGYTHIANVAGFHLTRSTSDPKNPKATARFIVHACNSYFGLELALAVAIARLEKTSPRHADLQFCKQIMSKVLSGKPKL